MRIVPVFLLLLIITFACSPAKQVQKIQPNISTVDTAERVVATSNKMAKADSSTKEVFEKIVKNKIDFSTFNAKVRVQYEGSEGADDATAFIRLKKDSALWLSLRGPLGVEGFRVLITRDSVKVMNPLKKNVQYLGIGFLQEITGIQLDFTTLQNLVVGNPVFIDTNIVSYKITADNQLLIVMGGKIYNHILSLDNTDYKILHSKLDGIEPVRSRSCDITYSNYENKTGILFSTLRKISVVEQSKLDVSLDFKQYSFNQPITFLFSIPKNYKRL